MPARDESTSTTCFELVKWGVPTCISLGFAAVIRVHGDLRPMT